MVAVFVQRERFLLLAVTVAPANAPARPVAPAAPMASAKRNAAEPGSSYGSRIVAPVVARDPSAR